MTFAWTPHRFSGGALALDVANSVILRDDAGRRVDRFAEPAALAAFSDAAARLSAEGRTDGFGRVPAERTDAFLALREAIDDHFRHRVLTGRDDPRRLAHLLRRIAGAIETDAGSNPAGLETSTAQSALRLLQPAEAERLKLCRHCGWLFADRSKNRSRIWCDMAVCGNREKAARHHRKSRHGRDR